MPLGESLEDTRRRVAGCWRDSIQPALHAGRSTLLVAHGNSLRALLMLLEDIAEADIAAVEVPHAQPIVYDLARDGTFERRLSRRLPISDRQLKALPRWARPQGFFQEPEGVNS